VVNTVVFLWISAGAVASSSPSHGALSTLNDFGRARGLSFAPLVATEAGRPLGLRAADGDISPGNDAAIVDGLEAELEQARTALSTLEEASASARLTRVESQLLAHPHLPQAAFLMSECLALQAQAARDQSPARAVALETRRAALEGPRALAFGAPLTPVPLVQAQALAVHGLRDEDQLELDATAIGAAREVHLAPGLHHARVWRRGRLVFATFFELTSEQSNVRLAAPSLVACSREDLADAATASPPSEPISCSRWAKVREEGPGIGVALCEHQRCGDFVHWERRADLAFTPIRADRSRGIPAWASLTIAGTAALLATGLVLWQSGAFEHGRPSAANWEYDGLNPQALPRF
jgi:hypothetical protein